jgi:signal transduction histidine kinase
MLSVGSDQLISASERIVRRSFEAQSKIYTSMVREDLLIDNIIGARRKLELARNDGSLQGYTIYKDGKKVEAAEGSTNILVKIEAPIYFANEGETWGKVVFSYSNDEILKERRLLKDKFLIILFIQTILLGGAFFFAFGYLYKSTSSMLGMLTEYIVAFEARLNSKPLEFIWSPVLSVLRQSSEKFKAMRNEAYNLERQAAVGRVSAQLTHDMRAPIGTFERLLFAKDEDLPKMKESVRDSVKRLYAMLEALRHGEVENLVKKSLSSLDFQFGYETLLQKAEEYGVTISVDKSDMKWSRLAGHSDNLINYQGGQYGQEEGSQNLQRRV